MVIFFNMKEAREFLLEHGFVYTLRDHIITGRHQARHGSFYKFENLGRVNVTFHGLVTKGSLHSCWSESGFDSIEDWLIKAGNSRFLHRVELVK